MYIYTYLRAGLALRLPRFILGRVQLASVTIGWECNSKACHNSDILREFEKKRERGAQREGGSEIEREQTSKRASFSSLRDVAKTKCTTQNQIWILLSLLLF